MTTRPSLSASLLNKYQELLRKHEALVQRLETRNQEHISTWELSSWGMEMTASGLAMLRGERVEMTNRRWHELVREQDAWRRVGGPDPETTGSLREVASHEARSLLAASDASSSIATYQRMGGEQLLELRMERLKHRKEPRILVLVLDITERVHTQEELSRAHRALAERERLRSLGEMVSGVVHDLDNTLGAMRLRLELLQRDSSFAERQRGHLDALGRIVGDAGTRLRQLRGFSRQEPEIHVGEPVQLADVVHEAVDIVRGELEHRAAQRGDTLGLEVRVPPLPLVKSSASDLRYVFINLLLNARDAMPHGGLISVHGHATPTQVVLTVADEGTGIAEEHLKRLFQPFFTTKGSQGSGLGLAMAYGVVSRASGTITATNRPEGGAIFTLTFPVLEAPTPEAPAPEAPAPEAPVPPRRGRRTPRRTPRSDR